MTIVLTTTNRWKVAEYRRFLARHAQTLLVEQPSEDPAVLSGWLATARAVLADESNIFDPAGDLVAPTYVGPARNICRLHAWVKGPDGRPVRRSYIREVAGEFDGRELRPHDPDVFDWDAAFRPTGGPTLERMDAIGLKSSAREQCLSAFARAYLHHPEPKRLRWRLLEDEHPDWALDPRLLLEHPLYQRLPPRSRTRSRTSSSRACSSAPPRAGATATTGSPGSTAACPTCPRPIRCTRRRTCSTTSCTS